MATLIAFLLAISIGLLTAEILAYAPRIAKWLINRAVLDLAETDRERYLEEWLAHANELPGSLQRFFTL